MVSATGNDSAIKLVDQLTAIAPVLVINYDDKSWQQLVTLLGEATSGRVCCSVRFGFMVISDIITLAGAGSDRANIVPVFIQPVEAKRLWLRTIHWLPARRNGTEGEPQTVLLQVVHQYMTILLRIVEGIEILHAGLLPVLSGRDIALILHATA